MTKAIKKTKTKTQKKKISKPLSVADILRKKKEEQDNETKKKENRPASKNFENNDIPDRLNSDFSNLRNTNEYLCFIDFMATPKEFRDIQNQGEFSKEFKVSENTLTAWKNRQGFWEDVREARRKYIRSEMLGTAIVALKRSILKDGKAPEVKLLFQLADEFEEKSVVIKKTSKLTEEQKAGFADRLKRWKNENLKV